MPKVKATITAVGGYVPEDVLSNADLEKMVETNDEWIVSRTGISERRILRKKGWAASDMAAEAVRQILEKRQIDPMEIDLLICGTVTADMVFPDTANTILDKIGAKRAFGFDINAACSGFLYSLSTASQFIETGRYNKVIVVGVDVMSSIIDYTDRATCIIFGDGAGAVLLEPTVEGNNGIIDFELKADGAGRQFLHMKAGGSLNPPTAETVARREHFVFQEGKSVFKYATTGMIETVKTVCLRNGLGIEQVDWLVPHQANLRIINYVGDQLGIAPEKVMINIQKYGNTTAATLPLCLWEWEDRLKKGDTVVLTAFGGGFTWGSVLIKWGY